MKELGDLVMVDVVGGTSGNSYKGSFRAKSKLTQRDRLDQDRLRRELIGDAAGTPSANAQDVAWMLSQLAVRVLESPSWWKNSADSTGIPGILLEDDDVVIAVFNAVLSKDVLVAKRLQAEAEKAQADLKVEAETKEPQ